MKTLENSSDKLEKIGSKLRHEVLEPAKAEAREIVEEAKRRAEVVIEEARLHAEELIALAKADIEKERNVFQSSLVQAASQSMESLRQSVEHELFNKELAQLIEKEAVKPELIANLLKAVVAAIEKEGVNVELEAFIPNAVNAKEVNALLGEKVLSRLKGKGVALTGIAGGAQVKLVGKHMTLDISSSVLVALMASYLRKDYRKLLFGGK